MRGWKFLMAALVLAVLGVTGAQAIEPGSDAIAFSLINPVSREEVEFPAILNKQPALIVFFNTACSACEAELKAAQDFLADNKNAFRLIGIAVDTGADATPRVIKYVEEKKLLGFTVLMDQNFLVGEKYGFKFTPASVGIGRDGKVKFVLNGFSRNESKAFGAQLESLAK